MFEITMFEFIFYAVIIGVLILLALIFPVLWVIYMVILAINIAEAGGDNNKRI